MQNEGGPTPIKECLILIGYKSIAEAWSAGKKQSRGTQSAAKLGYINPRFSSVLHPSSKGQHGKNYVSYAIETSSELFLKKLPRNSILLISTFTMVQW
jgi:hypothetical protein